MKSSLNLLIFLSGLLIPATVFSGAWTLPKGRVFIKSAIYHQSTSSRFCTAQDARSLAFREAGCTSSGHSAPFDPFVQGQSEATAVFTEVIYGVNDWFNVGVQIPFYSLRFTNFSNPDRPRASSLGDIRFYGKIRLLERPIAASLQFGAKSPTGDFSIDAEVVNVSEGQWDYEILGEIGKSLWPLPGYVNLALGYRFRNDNDKFDLTVENEFNALFETGYNITHNILLKGSIDWLRGNKPRIRSTGDQLLWRRELVTIAPSIGYTIIPNLQLEGGVRFSISGQDFPDGTQFIGGLSYQFSVFK